MHNILKLAAVLSFTSCIFSAKAQQANPAHIGSVKGLLQDTVHKHTVKSATVSVYRSDSTLINYQLSSNYGEFVFKNLPLNAKYYIEVSHISYQLLRQSFALSGTQSTADLKKLVLKPKDFQLDEVQVRIPPVRMNGDTLEFNAAAFKLDSNAVVEDLLRKIPNITLWGDGQITVNGREVKSLLVNGKEFFGGDFKMATQNISKNAVDKVQVYKTQQDPSNLLDSTLTVNLKLKKGKDRGHFGKAGGGYGTDERFEADANINFFGPKLQLGIIGAQNNVNKIANNIRTLTANSTFKGPGINVEYQPDFRATGINRTSTGGATFSYNFIEKPVFGNKKTVTANYYIQDRDNTVATNSETSTAIGSNDSKIFDSTTSRNNSLSTNQNFDSKFEYSTQKHQFTLNQNVSFNTGESRNQSVRNVSNQDNQLTSSNNTQGQNDFNNKGFGLSGDYRYNSYLNFKQKIRSFNARFNLNVNDAENERRDLTKFTSFTDAAKNRDFDRRYNNDRSNVSQQVYAEIPQLKRLFFGEKRLALIEFGISNDFNLNAADNKSLVTDFNNNAGDYVLNTYLSNNLRTTTISESPALNIGRSFSKRLSNRFNRSLSFNFFAKHKLSYQNNQSDKAFQNIRRSYSNFIPGASASYYKNQNGEYSRSISLMYSSDIRMPDIDQLAPLTDSANVYRLERGNLNLREAKTRDIGLSFNHFDLRGKNTLNYNFRASVNFIEDSFADSLFVNEQGQRILYTANADGYKSAILTGDIKKALKLKSSGLQINLNESVSLAKTPGYSNNVFSFSNNFNTTTNLSFNYTFKDKLAAETKQTFNYYKSSQEAFGSSYSGINFTSAFSGSYNVTKKFTLNSNISLNNSKAARSNSINFNIWNASAVYRFLKGNNAEFKLTALDILRENNSVLNTGSANSFTFSRRNVLQQYFMTTFSYYPRKFGKDAVKKKAID